MVLVRHWPRSLLDPLNLLPQHTALGCCIYLRTEEQVSVLLSIFSTRWSHYRSSWGVRQRNEYVRPDERKKCNLP